MLLHPSFHSLAMDVITVYVFYRVYKGAAALLKRFLEHLQQERVKEWDQRNEQGKGR